MSHCSVTLRSGLHCAALRCIGPAAAAPVCLHSVPRARCPGISDRARWRQGCSNLSLQLQTTPAAGSSGRSAFRPCPPIPRPMDDARLLEAVTSLGGRLLVLYHFPCPDGAFAALAAFLHFRDSGAGLLARAEFVPHAVYEPAVGRAGAAAPALTNLGPADACFLLDYAGPVGFAAGLAKRCGAVVVLDHHKTAAETLPAEGSSDCPPTLHVRLDLGRSGATISRDFFRPAAEAGSATLRLCYAYIEDADLWRWSLPESRHFHAGITASALGFDASESPAATFAALESLVPAAVIALGRSRAGPNESAIEAALDDAFVIRLGGSRTRVHEIPGTRVHDESVIAGHGTCLAVRGEGVAHLRSDLGHRLALRSLAAGHRGIGAVVYREEGMGDSIGLKVSLRSVECEDVAAVAAALGGGGHLNAASCQLPGGEAELDEWRASDGD